MNECPEILYPRGGGMVWPAMRSRGARTLLAPPAAIYGAIVKRKRSASGARRTLPPGVRVISVGNIEVGGTGKTPFSIFLARQLLERGYSPLYLSRGYRSVAERLDAVTLVPPRSHNGSGLLAAPVRLVNRRRAVLHREIGDEGAVVARRLPEVPLAVSRHKARALALAHEYFSPTHIILDDAFQSWRVHRDIDIVLLDPHAPFGNGRLIPAGSLREHPAEALARAHVVGVMGEMAPGVRKQVEAAVGGGSRLVIGRRRITLHDAGGTETTSPDGPVISLTAIARPQRFEEMLRAFGTAPACAIRYPDHHRYTPGDIAFIQSHAASRGIGTIVTTEKDWVKLEHYPWHSLRVIHARLEIDTASGDILRAIEKPQPGAAVS